VVPSNSSIAFLAAAALLQTPALALGLDRASPTARSAASRHSLLHSRELWATIDICNASDQPNTVGIRGSMPGDGHAHDTLYMSFRLQSMDATTKQWLDLKNASTAFSAVGAAKSARQGGASFTLTPVAGKPAFTLRGVVSFQWRRRATVLAAASRPTSAGRQSTAGSDPIGFSAATCPIG
jgi:hypothetical protein